MHKSPLRSRAESCGDDLHFILYGCGMTMKQVPSVLPAGTADDATGATAAADGAARRTLGATVARESALVLAGAVAIALIGQIRLPLPFTPVPVTLGTLAVLGAGGLLGARRTRCAGPGAGRRARGSDAGRRARGSDARRRAPAMLAGPAPRTHRLWR